MALSKQFPVLCFADDTWETIIFFLRLSSSRQALQNSFDFPAPVTAGHYSGNSFTRCEAVMLFGSLDPSPRALCLPLGGGLQWTLLFRVRSDKAWAFRASNTDLVELDDPLLILEDPSPIESAMRYTRVQVPFQFNAHAQYALHNIFRYILPIILV